MSADKTPKYSIIAPCYNEEAVLHELYRRLGPVMDDIDKSWELILINDGSRDKTVDIMAELRDQDPRVKYIDFARNFGAQVAITAGLDHASGQAIIIIDADLQDPPELIAQMIEKWQQGYEIVYAVRSERKGETAFKKFTASLFYRMIARLTNIDIPLDTGEFRLLDRKAVNALTSLRETNRFIRGMTGWIGFKQTGIHYVREERFAGETHYPLNKMFRLAIDAVTSFSYIPLQLATWLGFLIAGLSAPAIIIIAILRLVGNHAFAGQATTLITVLLLGGIQLIFLGIIGEYLGRIYDEVKHRPLYIIRESPGLKSLK